MGRGAPKRADAPSGEPEFRVVTLVAYDRKGVEIRRLEGFTVGRDQVGHGLSMAMGAALFVDPASGEVVRRWDPWDVLG